jgi:hypothetical protein
MESTEMGVGMMKMERGLLRQDIMTIIMNGLDMMDDRGIPTRTREPYPLPSVKITHREWFQHEKVKEHLGKKTFNEKILALRPDCFELLNYKSHPPIKAPLSN